MLKSLSEQLSSELFVGGIIGLVMLGVMARNAILGYYETMKKIRDASPATASSVMATAVSIGWDKDQIERGLQALEKIADAMTAQVEFTENISEAQKILSDRVQENTQHQLGEILKRLEAAERKQRRPAQRKRT